MIQNSRPAAPLQPAIQVGTEQILALIELERLKAEAHAQQGVQAMAKYLNSYQTHAKNVIAAERAKAAESRQGLLRLQKRFTQLREAYAAYTVETTRLLRVQGLEVSSAAKIRAYQEELQAEVFRVKMEVVEARKAQTAVAMNFDDLRHALHKVGITFSIEGNTLEFSGGWAVVLAELGSSDKARMNPEELHGLLGKLTRRLQSDRERISSLESRLLSSAQDQQKMTHDHELEMAALKQQVSMLRDAVHSQLPKVLRDSQDRNCIEASAKASHSTPRTQMAWNNSEFPNQQNVNMFASTPAQPPSSEIIYVDSCKPT